MASVVMHIVKLATYSGSKVLTVSGTGIGMLMGIGLIAGAYVGKRIVRHVSGLVFVLLVEATLLIAGVRFLIVK